MKTVKIMLMGIAIISVGISFGITGIAIFEALMLIAVPIGFIIIQTSRIKKRIFVQNTYS